MTSCYWSVLKGCMRECILGISL